VETSDSADTDSADTDVAENSDSAETSDSLDTDVAENSDSAGTDVADFSIGADSDTVFVRYRRSYMANLIQADEVIKDCYHFIKNTLLSYKKVKARVSWSSETFKAARIQCAKLVIKGKNLWLYLNLDPKDYADSKFFIKDLSDKPKFAEVPLGIKLRSDRSQKHAAILIADMMQKLGLEKAEREAEDFRLPHEDNEALIEKGLIKVYYSGEVTDTTNLATVNIDEMLNGNEEGTPSTAERSPSLEREADEGTPSTASGPLPRRWRLMKKPLPPKEFPPTLIYSFRHSSAVTPPKGRRL
jgi:predicted transport protein